MALELDELTQVQEGTLDLDSVAVAPAPSPPIAAQRAFKARFGMSAYTPTYDELYGDISSGREEDARQRSAQEVNLRRMQNKQKMLSSLNEQFPGQLSAADVLAIDRKIAEQEKYMDHTSVWEEMYAGEAVNQLEKTVQLNSASKLAEEKRKDPAKFERELALGRGLAAKTEYLGTIAQNAKTELENQSYIGFGVDLAKSLVPFYQDFKLRGKTDTSSFYGLLGTQLEAQAQDLFKLDFPEFKTKVNTIFESLKKDNPMLAAMWVHAMQGQSTRDMFLNNAFNAADTLGLPLATIGKVASGATSLTRAAVKDVVKAATTGEVTKAKLIAATGDIGEAAVQKAVDNLIKDAKGVPITTQRAIESIFTYLKADITDLKANPGRLTEQEVLNIENKYNALQVKLLERLVDDIKVERLPDFLASEAAVREIHSGIKGTFKGASDNILDMPLSIQQEKLTGVYHVDINFGAAPGKLFDSEGGANAFANWNGFKDFKVEQQGAGFMVTVTKPVSEVSSVIRNSLMETSISASPDGFYKNFVSGLRTSEDTLSVAQRENRKAATYGPSNLLKIAQDEAKEISNLIRGSRFKSVEVTNAAGEIVKVTKKDLWNDWERVVSAGRKMDDPENPGDKGYFFKSPVELDDMYLRTIGRLPHAAETEAYFAYKRFYEMDRILRNISVYKNKARLGAETHVFYTIGEDGKRIASPAFDGVLRNSLPGGDDTVLIVGTNKGKERMVRMDRLDKRMKDALATDIAEGRRRVVELWDPEARVLNGWGDVTDQRVRYVISHALDTKPLSWEQVPRRGGGHWEYEYDHYIKQARIRSEDVRGAIKNWYEGDTVVMPIAIRAMGDDVVKKLNEVRILLNNKDEVGALAKYNEHGIPIPWDEFRGWFNPGRDIDGKKTAPRLSMDQPFHVVQKNKSLTEIDDTLEKSVPGFNDGTKHGSLARQYQVQYTAERDSYDLMTLRDTGTRGKPLYSYEPAQLVDPVPAMHKAMARIINSTYLDDYKIFSVEHWIQEAKTHLKPSTSELRHAPFWHFNNPDYRRGVEESTRRRLETQRFQVQQLIGTPSTTDTALHSIAQKLADSAYTGLGPRGLALDPDWVLPFLKDPFRFIRAITYHSVMGFFAIPQLLTQMQTHATIMAIAGPKFAAPGSYAAQLYHLTKINKNPAILDRLDDMAAGLRLPGADNFKPGQLKEAINGMERTGFHLVGGEYAALDNMLTPKVVTRGFDNFLDAGTVFFRNGEQNVRYAAWFTAYKEFRSVNPTGRLTNKDLREILNRADLLNINMSRASASTLNTGVFSLTTQFLTYQIRLAELFFSKRLGETALDRTKVRARMLLTNAMLYGAPTAAGVTGLPLADFIRQKAVENGYVMGDKYVSTLINEGLPSVLVALASGNGDLQKGTFVNIGDKLGNQGFETLKEAMRGDTPWWTVLGGASLSKFSGAVSAMDPFWQWGTSMLREDNARTRLTPEDFVGPLKEISSVNTTLRTIAAINTGRWLSKKGVYLTDVNSPLASTMLGLTGLQPQRAVDLNILSHSNKDMNNVIKKGTDAFLLHFRRGLNTGKDDPQAATVHFKNAWAQLIIHGVPEEKWTQVLARAEDENRDLVGRMQWQYYAQRPALAKDRKDLNDAYSRQLQLDKKQRE